MDFEFAIDSVLQPEDQQQLQELTAPLGQVDVQGILSQCMAISTQQKGTHSFRTLRKFRKLRKHCKAMKLKMKPMLRTLVTVLEWFDFFNEIANAINILLAILAFL
ncbi:unnamed protein product [Ambrosiozyma monospora]|uniref:Unnamed protein product n=1 Tax=Ambrosiozyma monospora TaxID=43982 RepID=A0A9W6Z3I1_AMBMO|nr:unnamed protein product [Ambrosiozyma monospora]